MALHPLILYSQLSNGLDQTNKYFYPSHNSKSDKVQSVFFSFTSLIEAFSSSVTAVCWPTLRESS